ncbi:MAG: aconitate hydratase [Anaerolineae bacterium]|nr:aconitate hydratase [Anaerolineae bacterium]
MGKSLTQQIIEAHLVDGVWAPGGEIGIRIDQTLTQDATGTMTYLELEAMGIDAIQTELSVSYVDHNTIQVGYENADDHRYLQTVAARYGIVFSRAGNGICHQVHLERLGQPGKTLLGADSHTPTGGGIGMIAIGCGGIDVAAAMGGRPFYIPCPRVVRVELTGRLQPWVSAKDVVLEMLARLGTKGNVGLILEYGGPGVATLTVPERATIANMGAEMGVTTSLFPSDEETRRFLRAQGREADWTPLYADRDAAYDRTVEIDLGAIEPLCATPHSPGNVRPVRELAGLKVDQVEIGSCTNSSYVDLVTVAHILRGRIVHPDVSLAVTPGSRQVLQMIARDGALLDIVGAGARLLEPACGFCIGNCQSPGTDAVSLRTNNRNFEGRSGTPSACVYLVSPMVAAVAALAGELTDPRTLGADPPAVAMPDAFLIDDSMFLRGDPDPAVEIARGPNIGAPPRTLPLVEHVAGEVALVVGDKVTTDHISPAGPYLKYRSNIPRYAEATFVRVDPTFAQRAAANRDAGVHNVIVAGESYGQGSSREHAAICPRYLGVVAVVAVSYERIHIANLVNLGIAPLTFADPADYARIAQGDAIEIRGLRAAIAAGEGLVLVDRTRAIEIPLVCALSARERVILLAGGLLGA